MQNVGGSEEPALSVEHEDNVSSLADPGTDPGTPLSGELGRSESALLPEPSSSSPQQELEMYGPEHGLSEGTTSYKGKESRRSQEQLLKNRSAQRRFRERQKSRIIELEEWTAQLSLEIQQLKDDKEGLHSRNTALVRLAEQKNWQLERAKTSGFVVDEDTPIFTDALELTIQKGRTVSLQPEQVQALNREDLVLIWKEYTQRLSACLAVKEVNSAAVQAEVGQLIGELLMLLMRVSISSPLVLKAFAAYNMETGSNMEDDLENQYRSIVGEIGLSLSQRQEMVQLRQLFLSKQYAITRHRSDVVLLLVELQNTAPSLGPERKSSHAFLQAHEAAAAIRQSLQEEHDLKLDFMSTIFKHLMQPHQLAQCIIQSYPWFPDTLALTSWIAAEAGDAQAMAFFGGGELRHLSSQSQLSGFGLSRGGSGRPLAMRSLSGGGMHSTPHTSAGTGMYHGMPLWGQTMQTFSGQSGLQPGHSPVTSPLLQSQPISPHSPHFASPATSPRFPPEQLASELMASQSAGLATHNPFADGAQGPPWGI